MDSEALFGFGLVLAAGIMNGSFAAPMKLARQWAWENTWLAWSAIALVLFPVFLTFHTIPGITDLYRGAEKSVLLWVIFSGAGWGASQVLFGLGIARTGIALGFAVVVGLAAAAGSLVPLLVFRPEGIFSSSGQGIVAGVLIVLGGVALCSCAGGRRNAKPNQNREARTGPWWTGILLCVGAGIGGSMINIGMVIGGPLVEQAKQIGIPGVHQTNAVWLPLLGAGFVATSIYCGQQLFAHGTWARFLEAGTRRYWILALAMAICWFGSVEMYGIAASRLGNSGPVLGWPVFLSSSIITANVWGWITGEWRDAAAPARHMLLAGVGVLVAAIFVMGISGQTG